VKISYSLTAIVSVVALTIGAAGYRVTTAPDRIRLRLDAARATCVSSGGEWVKVGNEEACRTNDSAKKV
jgi:hypothetical protein